MPSKVNFSTALTVARVETATSNTFLVFNFHPYMLILKKIFKLFHFKTGIYFYNKKGGSRTRSSAMNKISQANRLKQQT